LAKTKNENVFRTTIGGQALMEGILMRGPKKQAIVVNGADGRVVKVEELTFSKDKYPVLGWPFIRGVFTFISSMANGVRALMFSAEQLPEEEGASESKLDKWIEKHFEGEKATKAIVTFSLVIGLLISVGLFILLPSWIALLFKNVVRSGILINLIEGVIRIIIFLAYMWLATRMKDIHRVFEYHGAEHKSIHCYEKGLPLTVENVRPQPRQHPRCGTSFLFVVMIISILVFSVVSFNWASWDNPLLRTLLRLALLPVVVAISYEINRWVGGHDNVCSKILAAPGKAVQHLTVFEPDDLMIETAIAALELVIPEEKGSDRW
jgi:uncharacterized protein YqhQ